MTQFILSYLCLGSAIVLEIIGTTALSKSVQFTQLAPSLIAVLCYVGCFYLFSISLKSLPVGIAYAIWAGVGIALTALVGVIFLKQSIDLAGGFGIGLILCGVMVINLFSNTAGH